MEFRMSKNEFMKGLRFAQSIADRKSTMPMLANVSLKASGNTLLVVATDLNVSVSAELQAEVISEGGQTVGAKALHDIVANLPGDEVSMKQAENNWAEVHSNNVNYKIVGVPDRDFPRVPDHREIEFSTVDPVILKDMIDKTIFSVCNDETRFHLNGVFLESDGACMRMVSTDGHRLSKIERTLEGAPKLSSGVIIPKKGLVEMRRILDGAQSCEIAIKTPHIFIRCNKLTLAIKLIESQFPPYDQVVPKEYTKEVVVPRVQLLEGLKRAQLLASETRGVKFNFTAGKLTISCENPDIGTVEEDIEIDYQGESLSIGFNGRYVLELLGRIAVDNVVFRLNAELDPGLVQPENDDNYLGVVMPMRI